MINKDLLNNPALTAADVNDLVIALGYMAGSEVGEDENGDEETTYQLCTPKGNVIRSLDYFAWLALGRGIQMGYKGLEKEIADGNAEARRLAEG